MKRWRSPSRQNNVDRRPPTSHPRRHPPEGRSRKCRPRRGSLPRRLGVAREQGARSFGLHAGLSLAKLYQSSGRPADAYAALAPALEGFSPTPEMPEIAEAQALVATLANADEVKAAQAQRQRRLKLQTAVQARR